MGRRAVDGRHIEVSAQAHEPHGYFPAIFADDEWARLQTAFSSGVCDYTKPGVNSSPPSLANLREWSRRQPLGPPPTSQALNSR